MAICETAALLLDRMRPCKQALGAYEQNAQASAELAESIARLTSTLENTATVRHRASDREDESWRRRNSVLR